MYIYLYRNIDRGDDDAAQSTVAMHSFPEMIFVYYRNLSVAACCSVLQRVAVCCSVLQRLQRVAECYSVLY